MTSRFDRGQPGDASWRRLVSRTLHVWPWLVAGGSATLAVTAITAGCRGTGTALPGVPWWQTPSVLAPPLIGIIVTGIVVSLVHQAHLKARTRGSSRHKVQELVSALGSLTQAPHSGYQTLAEQRVIDGYALWDADDRLIECKCFLSRYLPQLEQWRDPTARQIIAALIDGGQMLLPPGQGRDHAIDSYCQRRRQIPGLREFRMSDGQAFLARTIDLGHGQFASIFSNVTELRARPDGLPGDDAYRQAFDLAPSAKLLLDADFQPLAINRAAAVLLGHSLESLGIRGWGGLLPADEAADTPPWSPGPRRLLRSDGEAVRVIIGLQALGSTAHGRWLVSLDDVTAHAAAEDRLRLQAAILNRQSCAALAVDRNGRVIHGNLAAQVLFQWSDNVLPGTPVERLLGARVRTAWSDGAAEVETDGNTWSGTTFPAQVAISRFGDDDALPGGAVLVVNDLTPRRALDLQLMHSARLATLGEMAASIAHEFNQCLHVIRLSAEAVHLDLSENNCDVPRLSKRAENILGQVDRLTEMVTHMRAISRRETQEKRPFSPQMAVDAAVRMVEPLLKGDGIALVREGRVDGIMALGHQVRLEQVLLNLLNNARDAILDRHRQQGVAGGTITVTSTSADGLIRIAVRDDGTGIATAIGEHVFEPFVTTKKGGAGLGLGLSISRGICSEMGGVLRFCNVDGGAEFTIELPTSAETGDAAPNPPAAEAAEVADVGDGLATGEDDTDEFDDERRILLVDDEALSVMMVAEFLHRQGYQVDTAYDGLEAYNLCLAHVYHAVITDIRMPRMNGHELIARLEELQPGTPVIVVTGHLKEDTAADLGGNVTAVLTKPFQLERLREQLQRLDAAVPQRQQEGV